MAAEPRYRVSPTIGTLALIEKRWAVYDTQRSAGTGWANIVCSCDAAADANLIAAALNSAEDAGRWKAALEEADAAASKVHDFVWMVWDKDPTKRPVSIQEA